MATSTEIMLRFESAPAVAALAELGMIVRKFEGVSVQVVGRVFEALEREPLFELSTEGTRIVIKPAPCFPAVLAELRALLPVARS